MSSSKLMHKISNNQALFFTLQNMNHELQNETVKMDYRVQCTCIDLEPQKSYLLTQTINYAVFLTIKTINYGK